MTYVAHLGVRRRWLSTAPGPAVAAAALGVVLLLVANALPFTYDRNGKASAYSLFFHFRSPESWIALAPMLVTIVAGVAFGLLAAERQGRLAAGILMGAGISGYAYGLAVFGSTLALVPSRYGPKSGSLLFALASCAVGVAGLLASARVGGGRAEPGPGRAARAVAALGALGLALGAVVPLDSGDRTKALVEFPSSFADWSRNGPPLYLDNAAWWMVLIPGLAIAAALGAAFVGLRAHPRAHQHGRPLLHRHVPEDAP